MAKVKYYAKEDITEGGDNQGGGNNNNPPSGELEG